MQFQLRLPNTTQDQTIDVPAHWFAPPAWKVTWGYLVGEIRRRAQPAAKEKVGVKLPLDLGPFAPETSASLRQAVKARFEGDTSQRTIEVILAVEVSDDDDDSVMEADQVEQVEVEQVEVAQDEEEKEPLASA